MAERLGRRNGQAYYVIDVDHAQKPSCYKVWKRSAGHPVAELVGEFATMADAEASVEVNWQKGSDLVVAWAWGPESDASAASSGLLRQVSVPPRSPPAGEVGTGKAG